MKYEELFLLLSKYWQAERAKEAKELEELKKQLEEEFNKRDKDVEKLKLELEHPELFNYLTPKEYGQNLLKYGRSRKHTKKTKRH